jgi:AraC-like DNA-binding protein
MYSTLNHVNKSIPLERTVYRYTPASIIPGEYLQLVLPSAGAFFRQDEQCDILSQHLQLGPYSVWLHDIFSKAHIRIRSYTPIPILSIQFMFEDSLPLPYAGYALEERECNAFYLFPGQTQRLPMLPDKKIFSFIINIQPTHMSELIRQFPQFQQLIQGIQPRISARINTHPYHINAICDMLIRKIMTCNYDGIRAQYFLQRCISDILLNFVAQHADAQQPFSFESMVHTDTCHNIFNYLANHPHKIHALPALAYMYEIDQVEMERCFRQHFAISITDYMQMLRMMMTWHLIQSKIFPLSEVVRVAGFESRESMTAAIKAYYGINPEDLI